MRILWITNAPFPEISNKLNLKEVVKGWVYSSAVELIKYYKNIHLAVASLYSGKELIQVSNNDIIHFLIPQKVKTNTTTIKNDLYWKEINRLFVPDLVHIHGTEYSYAYSYVKACGAKNVVVSIQGLVSVIERYYRGGIKKTDLLKTITFWDFIRGNTIFAQHRDFQKRGNIEKSLIQNVNHVIGRTTWDRSHIWAINPDINYHFCNETLRPAFYNNAWDINRCERYSIFISQAYYPIKGFHKLIDALPIVLKYYPQTKVYVAGNNLFKNKSFRRNGYGHYINTLINKQQLANKIIFLGFLSEKEFCSHLRRSHIFVNPSVIENSSNSIGEAQILGVPCIASHVGGTPNLIEHNETGLLYRYEEVEMLAASICKIFTDNDFASKISEKSRIAANKRHNKKLNAGNLYNIYTDILKSNR
jgi:glycosyltransferase involved in cell wall biosynthesis